jgi:hypothetical protein
VTDVRDIKQMIHNDRNGFSGGRTGWSAKVYKCEQVGGKYRWEQKDSYSTKYDIKTPHREGEYVGYLEGADYYSITYYNKTGIKEYKTGGTWEDHQIHDTRRNNPCNASKAGEEAFVFNDNEIRLHGTLYKYRYRGEVVPPVIEVEEEDEFIPEEAPSSSGDIRVWNNRAGDRIENYEIHENINVKSEVKIDENPNENTRCWIKGHTFVVSPSHAKGAGYGPTVVKSSQFVITPSFIEKAQEINDTLISVGVDLTVDIECEYTHHHSKTTCKTRTNSGGDEVKSCTTKDWTTTTTEEFQEFRATNVRIEDVSIDGIVTHTDRMKEIHQQRGTDTINSGYFSNNRLLSESQVSKAVRDAEDLREVKTFYIGEHFDLKAHTLAIEEFNPGHGI